jgi:hypothetical protein
LQILPLLLEMYPEAKTRLIPVAGFFGDQSFA